MEQQKHVKGSLTHLLLFWLHVYVYNRYLEELQHVQNHRKCNIETLDILGSREYITSS